MKTFKTMLKNEMKLSLRDMNMVIFAICIPLVVLIILGVIYGNKPAYDGAAYTFLEQSFGALTTIAICAGGVMGLPLVVSDYRNRKILKRFKVTPVSPAMILAVQVVIYTIYSVASLILLYDCFSRWLSISYVVDIQHRHDGRRDFPELPDGERDSKPALRPDAYFFWSNAAV